MSEGEEKKARLEEILDGLEETMNRVRGEMDEFKTIRKVARGDVAQRVLQLGAAKFYVDIGAGPVEIPAPLPQELSEDVLARLMDHQGSKVATTWTEEIKPLVDEAVNICQQASDRGQEEGE